VAGCVRPADAGDRAGCFEFAAQFGVVDGEPPQVAEGGFELAGEVLAFAAQCGVLAGQFAGLAETLVLVWGGNGLPGPGIVAAEFGGDVVVVAPEALLRWPIATDWRLVR
jgi:hypothetical protein